MTAPAWPEGDYSIPMSVYGCGDMTQNQWSTGYLNISFKYPVTLHSSRSGETDIRMPSMLLGPHGHHSYQLNFCTKVLGSATQSVSRLSVWPPGNYSIFCSRRGCPAGMALREHNNLSLVVRKPVFVVLDLVPQKRAVQP